MAGTTGQSMPRCYGHKHYTAPQVMLAHIWTWGWTILSWWRWGCPVSVTHQAHLSTQVW